MSCRLCEKFLRCVLSPARIQRRTLQIPGKLPSKILPPTHIYSVEDIRPETSALSEGNLHLQKTNDFLENLRCSVSNWAIENSSSSNMWDQSIVWKDTKVDDFEASEMKLPTTENYSLAEKLARIGGKYKRPAFTRERIKKRHKKKKMRKNRFQIKQQEIMKEQEKIREWMAKFDLVRKEEVKVRNEAEQIKNIQRDLVNKIQNVIKRKPDIVKQIEQTEGTDFSEEIKIMNSVEKTASKEELIIKEIYRKSRSN